MQDLDKTIRFHSTISQMSGMSVTIFDADKKPYVVSLSDAGKSSLTFGRAEDNDIVMSSHLVSRHHGRFTFSGGKWYIDRRHCHRPR